MINIRPKRPVLILDFITRNLLLVLICSKLFDFIKKANLQRFKNKESNFFLQISRLISSFKMVCLIFTHLHSKSFCAVCNYILASHLYPNLKIVRIFHSSCTQLFPWYIAPFESALLLKICLFLKQLVAFLKNNTKHLCMY